MSNLSIAIVIGASVGGAVSGIGQLRASLATLRTETLSATEKIKALGQMSAASFTTAGSIVMGMGGTLAALTKPAIEFESSMVGVAKQLQGARDETGKLTQVFDDARSEILQMARVAPVAAGEIASIWENGLKQGVARDQLKEFAEIIIQAGEAFELPMGKLADDLGKIGNMYGRSAMQMRELMGSINYLDDNAMSTGADIIEVMQRVGGTASMVKMKDTQVAAYASTLLSTGERPETAATALNAVFSKLGAANTQSKPFHEMLDELGLTAAELEYGMQTDAHATIMKLNEHIRKLPIKDIKGATSQIDAVATLFGAEHWDTYSKLLNGEEELQRQIKLTEDERAKDSMQKEYEARLATTAKQIQLFKNSLSEVGINIGSILLPPLNQLMQSLSPIIQNIATWTKANPDLTMGILKIAGVIGLALAGFFAISGAISALAIPVAVLGAGFGKLRILMLMANGTYGLLSGAMRLGLPVRGILSAINAVRSLNILSRLTTVFTMLKSGVMIVGRAILFMGRAMLTNPIGLAITGIALAAYLIYQNWTPIKAFFTDLWADIREKTAPIVAFFQGLASGLATSLAPLIPIFGGIVDGIVSTWQGLISSIGSTVETVGNWIGARFTSIQMAVSGFIDGLTGLWQGLMSAFAPMLALFAPMFSSAFGGVIAAFGGLWQAVSSFVSPMIASLQSFFSFTVSGSQTTGQALGTWIGGKIVALVGIVGGAMSAIRGIFSEGIAGLISVIASFSPVGLFARAFAGVAGFFASLVGRFAAFGRSIVQGLINGINSMIGVAKAKIAELSNLAISAAKSTLGINSPSRVFKKIGMGVVHGLTLGVGQGAPTVNKASKQLAQSLVTSFSPRTDNTPKNEFEFAFTPLEHTLNEVNHTNSTQNQTINVHFNPVIHADNAVQQGQIKQGLQMSLREFEQMLKRVQDDQRRRAYV